MHVYPINKKINVYIPTKLGSIKNAFHEKSNLLLLNLLSLGKKIVDNSEAVLDKDRLSDCFYRLNDKKVALLDIIEVEYRSPSKKKNPLIDSSKEEYVPAFIRFVGPTGQPYACE